MCYTRGIGCSCILQEDYSFQLQAVGESALEPKRRTQGIGLGLSPCVRFTYTAASCQKHYPAGQSPPASENLPLPWDIILQQAFYHW